MRAILRYTDCLQDGKNVFRVLAENDVEILRTKQRSYSIYPEITILIANQQKLNELLGKLNCGCTYEVRLMKTQKGNVCDYCKERGCCSSLKKLFRFLCKQKNIYQLTLW